MIRLWGSVPIAHDRFVRNDDDNDDDDHGNPKARTPTTALLPRTTAPTPTSATSYPTTTKSTTINTQALSTLEECIRPVVGMGFPRDKATEALQVHQ